jgi:hypothetical protein
MLKRYRQLDERGKDALFTGLALVGLFAFVAGSLFTMIGGLGQ